MQTCLSWPKLTLKIEARMARTSTTRAIFVIKSFWSSFLTSKAFVYMPEGIANVHGLNQETYGLKRIIMGRVHS